MTGSNDRFWRRAHEYLAKGQTAPAQAVLESLLARDPTNIHAHLMLGGVAWREGRMKDSAQHALDAAHVVRDDGVALIIVARALLQVGELTAARECLSRPYFDHVRDGDLLVNAAGLRQQMGEHRESLTLFERAKDAGVDTMEFRFNHATQLSFNGRLSEAETELEYCASQETTIGRAYVELARLRRQTPQHNHLQLLDRLLERATPGSLDHAGIEFARYKELEDVGRQDEAWDALAHGNALMAARTYYDAEREERLHAGLRDVFADRVQVDEVAHAGPAPIFVIGMTRSGTTLLDRILGNHSCVESAGELGDFGRQLRRVAGTCSQDLLDEHILARLPRVDFSEAGQRYLAQVRWRANGKPFLVDKLPHNWLLAGPIRRALPRARILQMVRDPMDVCFSNFRALFGEAHGWSYQMRTLAHHYLQYRKMMAHWHAVMPGQILEVGYADLVRDPESTARRVFEFCGLDWEHGCIDLTRNTTSVATLSMAQVRGGIHRHAFEEWRPYKTHLAELRTALAC